MSNKKLLFVYNGRNEKLKQELSKLDYKNFNVTILALGRERIGLLKLLSILFGQTQVVLIFDTDFFFYCQNSVFAFFVNVVKGGVYVCVDQNIRYPKWIPTDKVQFLGIASSEEIRQALKLFDARTPFSGTFFN